MTLTLDIRPMRLGDLEMALGWARAEGWDPGQDDAAAFHAADPGGFFMGWIGTVAVACISVVKYGESFAFLGLYIVRPEHRGRGYGKAIWDVGMASAAGRTIGLDGVPDQQDNYRRSGFAYAYGNARWSGRLNGLVATRSFVRPIGIDDLAAIVDYDRQVFPAPRDSFLGAWMAPSSSRHSEGYFEDGVLRGYATIRRTGAGWKIGPLFADSPAIAESLVATMVAPAGTDLVFIDIPSRNAAAVAMATRLGFRPAFETARMYAGEPPQLPLERIFGVTTLELG